MIIIDDPSTWPNRLVEALEEAELVSQLRGATYIDDLEATPSLVRACRLAESLMAEHGVGGFHFTKEPYGGCFANGLRVLDMKAHHHDLLELLAPHFGPELTGRARARLTEFAASDQRSIREGKLWFCLARKSVSDPGIHKFVRFVGGEAIYWWLWRDSQIAAILQSVGVPVVVETILCPSEMRPPAGQWRLGESLVSHYAARRINAEFFTVDTETYIRNGISPERIVAVHPLEEFREKWG